MDLNSKNIEAWLLDLIEGNLSEEEATQLRQFLLLNPGLAEDFDELEPWTLDAGSIKYTGKERLYKIFPDHYSPVVSEDMDMLSIARLEGDLSLQQEESFDLMVSENPSLEKEWEAWQRTRLPAEALIYMDKKQLIRSSRMRSRVMWMTAVSAAAAIALLFVLFRAGPEVTEVLSAEETVESQIPSVERQIPSVQAPAGVERAPVLADNTPVLADNTPVLVADTPVPVADTPVPADDAEITGTPDMSIIPEHLEYRSLSYAVHMSPVPGMHRQVTYDQITRQDFIALTTTTTQLDLARESPRTLQEASREFLKEKNINFFTVTSAGLDGINRLTGSNLSLDVSKSDEGEVKGFRFRSRSMNVDAPLGKTD